MLCVSCNDRPGEEHVLDITDPNSDIDRMKVVLCEVCSTDILSPDRIERRESRRVND